MSRPVDHSPEFDPLAEPRCVEIRGILDDLAQDPALAPEQLAVVLLDIIGHAQEHLQLTRNPADPTS